MTSRYAIIVGLVLGLVGFAFAVTGYGYALYYWRYPLLIVPIALAMPVLFKSLTQAVVVFVATSLISLSLWYAGIAARRVHALSTCRHVSEFIDAANSFKQTHGRYPTNIAETSCSLPKEMSFQFKQMGPNGQDLAGMNQYDVTVYASTNDLACVVPVTKMLFMSFSRFYVYSWSSKDPNWKYHKVVWHLGKL
jgi:hypothetical protein